MEKIDFIEDGGRWWIVRRLTQWEIRKLRANRVCPRCDGKEELNHDCKRKSWAVLVVEEDDPDDEGILIVFDRETKKKETEIKIENSDDKKSRSTMSGAQREKSVGESTKFGEKYIEVEAVQFIKERDEKLQENGWWKETREKVEGNNPTHLLPNPKTRPDPKIILHKSNPASINQALAQYPTQFFINPPPNPTKIYDPGPNNSLTFIHPISNHLSTRPNLYNHLIWHQKFILGTKSKMANVVETFTFQAEVNQRSSFVGNSSDASDKDKAISFFHTWSHFALSIEAVVTQALSNFDRQSKSPFSYLSISIVDLYSPPSFEFFDEFVSGMFDATLNPSSRSSEAMAMKLQKVCKSFRKWRKLVDSAVIAKELWWIFVMSTSKKFYVSKKKNRRRKGERERLRIVAMASLRLRRQESSPRQQDSLRSPEAELGVKVEDLWDVLEPQLSPTEKLNACFEGIPVSAFPLAPSSQLIEIKSDTSLAEAVEILGQNKILSAPVVDVNASEDASWMDRYIGIVEFARIVVWILHQIEPPSPRSPNSPTAFSVAVNGRGKAVELENLGPESAAMTSGNFFEALTTSDLYKNTKVGDVSGSFRWAPFLALQSSNSFLTMLLLLSKYKMKSIPLVDLDDGKVNNIITQSSVVHMLAECAGLQWFESWGTKKLSEIGLPVMSAKQIIKVAPSNQEYKVTRLSEKPCREQMFSLKQKNVRDEDGEVQSQEITVYDYFVNRHNMDLRYSADIPCINVGKPKRPTYIPLKLCSLVSLQRYTKALNTLQRASLVEKSRQKPQERMNTLSNVLRNGKCDAEPMLHSCGISMSTNFAKVEGRVLSAPRFKVGNGEDFFRRNGRWNFDNKKLVEPTKIERWAVVNLSVRCDIRSLVRDLIKCGDMKGLKEDLLEEQLEGVSEYKYSSHRDLELLNKWKGLSDCKWTWESCNNLQYLFPQSHLEDKVSLHGRGNVRDYVYMKKRRNTSGNARRITSSSQLASQLVLKHTQPAGEHAAQQKPPNQDTQSECGTTKISQDQVAMLD